MPDTQKALLSTNWAVQTNGVEFGCGRFSIIHKRIQQKRKHTDNLFKLIALIYSMNDLILIDAMLVNLFDCPPCCAPGVSMHCCYLQ